MQRPTVYQYISSFGLKPYICSHVYRFFIVYVSIGASVTSPGVAIGGTLPPGLTEEEAEEIQVELTKVQQTLSNTLYPQHLQHNYSKDSYLLFVIFISYFVLIGAAWPFCKI